MKTCCFPWVILVLISRLHLSLALSINVDGGMTAPTVKDSPQQQEEEEEEELFIVLVKVGGSSITDKGRMETLNDEALEWLARTMKKNLHSSFLAPTTHVNGELSKEDEDGDENVNNTTTNQRFLDDTNTTCERYSPKKLAFILVHGAGSFGHFHAKQFGLSGQYDHTRTTKTTTDQRRFLMQGVAQTRSSVQLLNHYIVSALIQWGINAVRISPGPWVWTHPNQNKNSTSAERMASSQLRDLVKTTLEAGLIPVLHGDVGWIGTNSSRNVAILSGDVLVEWLAEASHRIVFLTDVPGVYTDDPKLNPKAIFLPWIKVLSFPNHHPTQQFHNNQDILLPPLTTTTTTTAAATGKSQSIHWGGSSQHPHDVTGGLATKLASAIWAVRRSRNNATICQFGSNAATKLLSYPQQQHKSTNSDQEEEEEDGTVLFLDSSAD